MNFDPGGGRGREGGVVTLNPRGGGVMNFDPGGWGGGREGGREVL